MAGSLGGLYFEIGARTGNLKKGIAQAQNALNQLDRTGKKVSNSLNSIIDRQALNIVRKTGGSITRVRNEIIKTATDYKKQGESISSAMEKTFEKMGIASDKGTSRMIKNAQKVADEYNVERRKLFDLGFTDDQMKTYKGTTLPTKFNLHNLGIPSIPDIVGESGGYLSKAQDFSSITGVLGRSGEISSLPTKLQSIGSAIGKAGSVASSAIGEISAVASKAGPYVMAVVEVLKKVGEVLKPFVKIYLGIMKGVLKTTGSIASKIGNTLLNGLISPIKKGFEKLINPFGKSFGNRLGTIIGAGAFAGLSYKLKNFTKNLLESGADFEQMTQGIQILFADTRTSVENNTEAINAASDRMRENAMMAYKTTGMSANDYMSQASGFATRVISELEGDTDKAADVINTAMQDMSDNWHLLGGDFESIRVAYQGLLRGNYRTFDNLKLGYGQTKGEVQRLLRDAERLSGETYDIDKLSDIMMAIHEIQKATGMTGTTAREALTTWAGAVNMLKNAWMNFKATVGQGLIYILRPVLQIIARISDALVSAGLRFMKWAQKITGIKDLVVGKKNDEDYSSAATGIGGVNDALGGVGSTADKAKKAVKELKRELMGFDEINKLTGEKGTDTGSGTSGSGSGTGVDLDDLTDQSWMNRMIESAGEDLVTFYEEKIKEAWENADFTIVGWNVAEKIADALENINWTRIKNTCSQIGKSIATFINGFLIDDRLWSELGKAFGNIINSIINFGYEFVANFYWTGLGEQLARGINQAIYTIDTAKIGQLISERIKGGLDFAISLISNINYKELGNKIAELLFNIDWKSIRDKAGELGKSIATALNEVFANTNLWSQVGQTFGKAITSIINYGYNFVTTFDWEQFGQSVSTSLKKAFERIDGQKLGKTISDLIHGVFTFLKTILEDEETWNEIYKTIEDALDEIDFPQLIDDAFTVSNDVTKRLIDIGIKIAKSIGEGFAQYMRKEHPWLCAIFGLTPLGMEIKTIKFIAKVAGEKEESYRTLENSWGNFHDKTSTATGKGYQHQTLGQLVANWFKVDNKTSTVTGKGNPQTSFGQIVNNWGKVNNKTSTVTAAGKKAPNFDSTKKKYDDVKNKNATVKISLKTILEGAWNTVARKFNDLKTAHPIIMKAFPKLPMLAQGGFVKRNTPQLTIIGDNRREGEIVAPESKLAAMAQMAANNSGNAETNALLRQLISLVGSMNLNVELDGEAIKNNTVRRINNHTRSTGQLEILI